MKCDLCDAEGTFHATEVHEDGDSVSRQLCIDHAREAGYPVPPTDEMNASLILKTRMLAKFLRTKRRMPSPDQWLGTGGAAGPPRHDTEDDIDAYIICLDALAEFVERNARLPTDSELPDPF